RPVTPIEETEQSFALRNAAHSSQDPPQVWTSQPQSFSSYSSREYDSQFREPPSQEQILSYHSTFHPQRVVEYPGTATSYPQYFSESVSPSQPLGPSDPYPTLSIPGARSQISEVHGPPSPYPYLPHYPQVAQPPGNVRRQSLPEIPPRGRSQISRQPHRGRRVSPTEPYHVRRASHDVRSQS